MVRVKHRYLAAEILYPSQHPTIAIAPTAQASKQSAAESTLLFHRPTPNTLTSSHLIRAIRSHLQLLFGETGAALAGGSGLKIVYFSNATSTLIVRCRREACREVWAALCFIRSLQVPDEKPHDDFGGGRGRGRGRGGGGYQSQTRRAEVSSKPGQEVEVVVRVVKVSGTIRKSGEEIVRRSRQLIGKVKGLEEVAKSGEGEIAHWLGRQAGTQDGEDDDMDDDVEVVVKKSRDDEAEDDGTNDHDMDDDELDKSNEG
ncbi:MAG: hypothetical protein M1828_007396 [Chrysothrix sp. TS-e1954]|nr:MAG: hypothetical protein M1828_007396 [Chrysothrix sp. TS-e1954]